MVSSIFLKTNTKFQLFEIFTIICVFVSFCSGFAQDDTVSNLIEGQIKSPFSPRDPRQFRLFEWLFGPVLPENRTATSATSHKIISHHYNLGDPSVLKKLPEKNIHLGNQSNKSDTDKFSSSFLENSTTTLIQSNNSAPTGSNDPSILPYGPIFAKPRSVSFGDRTNHSRQIVITDIQKSERTEIDESVHNSDPSQLNLQEELDAIDKIEKNLGQARTLLQSNKTRTKRQSKSSSSNRFRQLNIPYGVNTNNVMNTFGKRQLLLNPVDQQMIALRQQQELAAATILTQQHMLNRLNNRFVDDYYDDDSSYEDSDERFDNFDRFGLQNPLADAMRRGQFMRPNHFGIGKRSVTDEKIPKDSVFNQKKGKRQREEVEKVSENQEEGLLGPISKQGRWDTIEDYDLTSEFNRIESRKGIPEGSIRFNSESPMDLDEESQEDVKEDETFRIGNLGRHVLGKGRQESSTDSSPSETELPNDETSENTSSASSTEAEEMTTVTPELTETEMPNEGAEQPESPSSTVSPTPDDLTTLPTPDNSTTDLPSSNGTTTPTDTPKPSTTKKPKPSTTKKPKPSTSTTTKKPRAVPPYQQTLNCRCGVQSVRGEDVGDGTIIRTMVNPWLVSISSKQKGTNTHHLCSGSIINNRYIMTSKQCVQGKKGLIITAGTGSREAKNFTVTKVNLHESRDIALLKFKPALNPNQSMRPICLPLKNAVHEEESPTGTLVTFKKSNARGNVFLQLVQTEVPMLSKCSVEDGNNIPTGTLCPGPPGSLRCGGDTGGILQVYHRGFSYEQIGVVSNTVGCRTNNAPGVYTDVRKSVKWILYNTKDARYCRKPKVTTEELMNARRIEADESNLGESEEEEEEEEEFDADFLF